MKIGEQHCEVDPSPLYTSSTYTLIAPAQSKLPPDFNPGWDTQYPSSQIPWQPNPDAPDCLKNDDIRTMHDWIKWIQENIIKVICEWQKTPCLWMISDTLRPIGETLADCLKMSDKKYTVVYDATGKIAIAGEILDESTCSTFIVDMKKCILNSLVIDAPPKFILGTNANEADQKPYWYSFSKEPTTKIIHKFGDDTPNNRRSSVLSGARLIPLAEDLVLSDITEGNSYNPATGVLTIAKEGFYRFNLTTFVQIGYQPMGTQSGALGICYLLGGILIELGVDQREVRLFQQPFWREYGTDITQNLKMSYSGFIKAGTKITPRIWIGYDTGTINVVKLNVQPNVSQLSLSRIAKVTLIS